MKENIIFESKDFQYLCSYFFKNLSSEKKKKKIELKVFQNKTLGFIVLEIEQEINNKNFPKRKVYSYILGDIYEEEVFFYSNLGSSFINKSLNEPEALIELDKNKNYFYNAFYEAIINIDYEKDKGNWAKFIKENQNIYKEILKISSLFKQDQEKLNQEENIFSKSNILNLVESIQEKNTLSKEEIAEFIEKIKSFLN